MIHNDVLNQLQLLVKTSVSPLLEVADTPAELPQWVSGQKLPAHVLASLPNGRFQVSVDNHVLDMNLPKNTQPGENVVLLFVADKPRLTFVLSRETQSSNRANAASASAAASRGEPPLPLDAGSAKAGVTLSETAKFLGVLMQKVAQKNDDSQASPLLKTAPLVLSPPADSKEFAQILRGALSQSGLFYESHQAQWVAGERSLTELLHEPQGKLSLVFAENTPPPNTVPKAPGASVPPSGQPPVGQSSAGQSPALDAQKAQVLIDLQADAPALPTGSKPLQMVHPDTMPLIQQQLNTLDARQMTWQGQVWPGQTMEWIVEERQARSGDNGDDEPVHWQTKLRLQLPSLGNVSAALAFTPQGLRISLVASEQATAETLKAAQGKLQKSLDAAGLPLLGLTVGRDDNA